MLHSCMILCYNAALEYDVTRKLRKSLVPMSSVLGFLCKATPRHGHQISKRRASEENNY